MLIWGEFRNLAMSCSLSTCPWSSAGPLECVERNTHLPFPLRLLKSLLGTFPAKKRLTGDCAEISSLIKKAGSQQHGRVLWEELTLARLAPTQERNARSPHGVCLQEATPVQHHSQSSLDPGVLGNSPAIVSDLVQVHKLHGEQANALCAGQLSASLPWHPNPSPFLGRKHSTLQSQAPPPPGPRGDAVAILGLQARYCLQDDPSPPGHLLFQPLCLLNLTH